MRRLRSSDFVNENRVISIVDTMLVYCGGSSPTTDQCIMPSSSSLAKRARYSVGEAYSMGMGRGLSALAVLMCVEIAV